MPPETKHVEKVPQSDIHSKPAVAAVAMNSSNITTDFVRTETRPELQERNSVVSRPDVSHLYKESERLKTFENWPVPFLAPKELAAAGFYFLKRDDVVRCIFCGVEVGRWVQGDNPMEDHKKWSPGCRFINKFNVGNIPIEPEVSPTSVNSSGIENGYDVCGPYGIELHSRTKMDHDLPEKLGIHKSRGPSFPHFADLETRQRSFQSWPISLKLKPKTLSDAGFFYTGKGDQTVCYHCGGGLKDWEETDEPWVEHARWFSKCSYVYHMKGQEFIDEVNGKRIKESKQSNTLGNNLSSSTGDLEKVSTTLKESSIEAKKRDEENAGKASQSSSSGICSNSSSDNNDGRLCKLCYEEEMGVAFLPCGHLVACAKCALSLSTCAICRQPFTATIRVFLS